MKNDPNALVEAIRQRVKERKNMAYGACAEPIADSEKHKGVPKPNNQFALNREAEEIIAKIKQKKQDREGLKKEWVESTRKSDDMNDNAKCNTEENPMLHYEAPRHGNLTIWDHGELMVKVNFDGTIEFGENYHPDKASRLFWQYISGNFPGYLHPEKNTTEAEKDYDRAMCVVK